jgi:hypothetical protein
MNHIVAGNFLVEQNGVELKNILFGGFNEDVLLKNDLLRLESRRSDVFETIFKEKKSSKLKNKEPKKKILCATCRQWITNENEMMVIAGSSIHIFKNPQHIFFQVGCFKKVRGCLIVGIPTMEYTWFLGYTWNFTYCRKCHSHLGWFYQSAASNFFGLILNKLICQNFSPDHEQIL